MRLVWSGSGVAILKCVCVCVLWESLVVEQSGEECCREAFVGDKSLVLKAAGDKWLSLWMSQ